MPVAAACTQPCRAVLAQPTALAPAPPPRVCTPPAPADARCAGAGAGPAGSRLTHPHPVPAAQKHVCTRRVSTPLQLTCSDWTCRCCCLHWPRPCPCSWLLCRRHDGVTACPLTASLPARPTAHCHSHPCTPLPSISSFLLCPVLSAGRRRRTGRQRLRTMWAGNAPSMAPCSMCMWTRTPEALSTW